MKWQCIQKGLSNLTQKNQKYAHYKRRLSFSHLKCLWNSLEISRIKVYYQFLNVLYRTKDSFNIYLIKSYRHILKNSIFFHLFSVFKLIKFILHIFLFSKFLTQYNLEKCKAFVTYKFGFKALPKKKIILSA